MTLSITIDWLAFTFKENTHEKEAWLSKFTNSQTAIPITARNGYASALREENEIIHMWHYDREEMGHHVIINGTSLRHICEQGVYTQQTLLQSVLHSGGSITRLDLAEDVQNEVVDYNDIWSRLERREYIGNAQKTARLQGGDGGYTIYIGSRTSERFLRLYDKAIQSNQNDVLWTRLELETKGMVARRLGNLLCSTDNWSGAFISLVNGMVQIEQCLSWDAFLPRGTVPIGIPKLARASDTEKWIETQVISAVAKHYIEHPDSVAIQRLRDMINLLDEQSRRNLQTD